MMTIFLNARGANGFTKWSIAHPPNANDDDEPGGATPMAIALPAFDDEPIIAVSEQPDRPWLAWLMPKVGHPPEQRRPKLKALADTEQIGPWHIGQWTNFKHTAIRMRFASIADGERARETCTGAAN